MTFAELQETKGWKNFMSKLYGIGAAVVIIGALFKIMHWPGASAMLIAGLGTEAVIFFFSAFTPLHEELDWTLVYPELAGLDPEDKEPIGKDPKTPATNVSLFDQKLFEGVKDAPAMLAKLTKGMENLGTTANSLTDLSKAVEATNGYTSSMNAASKSVGEMSNVYKGSVENVKQSINTLATSYKQSAESVNFAAEGLADTYSKTSKLVTTSTNEVAAAYKSLTAQMKVDIDFSSVTEGNKNYTNQLSTLNKNLTALNAVFELQLQGGLDEMMEDLNKSVSESHKYSAQVAQLSKRVETLNNVYGKMLSAMNVQA